MNPATLTLRREPPTDAILYRPADVAHEAGCHPSTVKAVAESLKLDVIKCPDNSRLYTSAQRARIILEIEKRRIEALR